MGRKRVFVVVWCLLFGTTVGIHSLLAHPKAKSSAEVPADDLITRALFEATPMKTVSENQISYSGELDNELNAFLHEPRKDSGLRRCRRMIMPRSDRNSEYFEVSFIPRRAPPASAATLEDVIVERASIRLTSIEDDCIRRQFNNMSVNEFTPRNGRVRYKFCFKRLSRTAETTTSGEQP